MQSVQRRIYHQKKSISFPIQGIEREFFKICKFLLEASEDASRNDILKVENFYKMIHARVDYGWVLVNFGYFLLS